MVDLSDQDLAGEPSFDKDSELYPSKTLVLENIHARTTVTTILNLLDRIADLDPGVIHEIRLRNAKRRGRYERHAFLEFWQKTHAVWVYEHVGHVIRLQCPRPLPGEVGCVVDENGAVVTADSHVLEKRCYVHIRVVFWQPHMGRGASGRRSNKGWECPECALPNYTKWDFCYRCGVQRQWSAHIVCALPSRNDPIESLEHEMDNNHSYAKRRLDELDALSLEQEPESDKSEVESEDGDDKNEDKTRTKMQTIRLKMGTGTKPRPRPGDKRLG